MAGRVRQTGLVLALFLAVVGSPAVSAEQVVFSEDFDGPQTVVERGWERSGADAQSTWGIVAGKLKATCFFSPYKGGGIRRPIRYVPQGELSFEATLNSGGGPGYQHLSLQVGFYNLMTSFTGLGNHRWMRYYQQKWQVVADGVPQGRPVRFKIRFAAKPRVVEYYVDDMDHPTYIDTHAEVAPPADGRPPELWIVNYGLAGATMVHLVDWIRLTDLAGTAQTIAPAGASVYQGIAFQPYRLGEVVQALGVAQSRVFTVTTLLAETPRNRFGLDRLPSLLSSTRDEWILMADVPLGPGGPMPEPIQARVCQDVAAGAHLVIFGGLFTLNKGRFGDTPLAAILPFQLSGAWDVARLTTPTPIRPVRGPESPCVLFCHPGQLAPDAQVLAWAGEVPFVITHAVGQGRVTVFAGMPCGQFPESRLPFWQWQGWPSFVHQMVTQAGEAQQPRP